MSGSHPTCAGWLLSHPVSFREGITDFHGALHLEVLSQVHLLPDDLGEGDPLLVQVDGYLVPVLTHHPPAHLQDLPVAELDLPRDAVTGRQGTALLGRADEADAGLAAVRHQA